MTEEAEKIHTWIYHADKKPTLVTVTAEELEALEADGWQDSPVEQADKVESNDQERDELLERFNEEPTDLTKDELVKLGRYLGVKMLKAWKEETLIEKVRSGLE